MGAQEAQQVTQSAEPRARDLGQQNDPSLTDLFSSRSTRKGILYLFACCRIDTMGVALATFYSRFFRVSVALPNTPQHHRRQIPLPLKKRF